MRKAREIYLEKAKLDLFFKVVDGVQKRADSIYATTGLEYVGTNNEDHFVLMKEVLEPSSELGDVEEMAKYYAEECDNESGSFLSRDLIKIRVKSFKAGHASRQQEVDELKHSKLNLLDACSDFEIGIENLQCDRQKLESEISTITKQLDEANKKLKDIGNG